MGEYRGKDAFTDCKENIENSENLQRADKQCKREYIASFDSKYRQLEKLKIKLPKLDIGI